MPGVTNDGQTSVLLRDSPCVRRMLLRMCKHPYFWEILPVCVAGVSKDRKALVGNRNMFRLIFLFFRLHPRLAQCVLWNRSTCFRKLNTKVVFYVACKGQGYYHRTCGLTAVSLFARILPSNRMALRRPLSVRKERAIFTVHQLVWYREENVVRN